MYLALRLQRGGETYFGYLNIPSDHLPRFYRLQRGAKALFIYLDDILKAHLHRILRGYEVLEAKAIKLNRDADLHITDEYSGDLVKKISKQIQKRDLGVPSRFLFDGSLSAELLEAFVRHFELDAEDLVKGGTYHNLSDFWQISPNGNTALTYPLRKPVPHREIEKRETIFQAIEEQDQLLHFPYQSYDYVLQFFNEASADPEVTEIYVAFYRMAKHSVIGDALISAAHNGKKVVAFIEVKARFDEKNNLLWAARFQEAGITTVYSIPGLKVHAKIALIRKKETSYAFFGTGNLNEQTAAVYGDYGLLTARKSLTKELRRVFHFLYKRKTPKKAFEHLLVSQFNALEQFHRLIDEEIAQKAQGKEARIIIKVNNLQEESLIRHLYQAARQGVEVSLIVRSICCLIPDTEGIKVYRLVGRYLEHARIFYFHQNGADRLYIGSSDWMNRNLHRRVEVSVPIEDQTIKQQLLDVLHLQLTDNVGLVRLDNTLQNIPVRAAGVVPRNAQEKVYELLRELYDDAPTAR